TPERVSLSRGACLIAHELAPHQPVFAAFAPGRWRNRSIRSWLRQYAGASVGAVLASSQEAQSPASLHDAQRSVARRKTSGPCGNAAKLSRTPNLENMRSISPGFTENREKN
ncbi:MAG: hypothetical protein Q8Q62_02930, partial [Mesorhizobium sp.]|nr:hypothetical protein [Mesorhizobium sp.]